MCTEQKDEMQAGKLTCAMAELLPCMAAKPIRPRWCSAPTHCQVKANLSLPQRAAARIMMMQQHWPDTPKRQRDITVCIAAA